MSKPTRNPKNRLLKALDIIARWFESHNIPYMVFGGVANSIYGNPRQTFDIDIKISLEPGYPIENFIEDLRKISTIIPHDPISFINETQVLPIDLLEVRINIVFAGLPFEIEAIQRSRVVEFGGVCFNACTVEDLIIHKAVSTRQKDWLDIDVLIKGRKNSIDWDYLLKHCEELGCFLDRPEIISTIYRLKDEA